MYIHQQSGVSRAGILLQPFTGERFAEAQRKHIVRYAVELAYLCKSVAERSAVYYQQTVVLVEQIEYGRFHCTGA